MGKTSVGEIPSLIEIADYHSDASASIPFYLRAQFRAADVRFLGYTRAEFDLLLRQRLEETDLRSSLIALSTVEAALRVDYQERVNQRKKDSLSRSLRELYRNNARETRFDDVLDQWQEHHPELKDSIGQLRSTLHFRHWLAHGRYWERPKHGRFDFASVYTLADAILSQFPLVREA